MAVLVGGVGYRNLCDHSFGVLVSDALAGRWPVEEVLVEDISYGPIAVVQRLQDDRPSRVVIVAAAERIGREPGTLTIYRWDGRLPDAEQIQTAVSEAVTGVISLDNTLIVAQHFRALPEEVIVIETQPANGEFGDELSEMASNAFPRACELAVNAATDERFVASLMAAPLGGGAPRFERSFRPRVSDVPTRTV